MDPVPLRQGKGSMDRHSTWHRRSRQGGKGVLQVLRTQSALCGNHSLRTPSLGFLGVQSEALLVLLALLVRIVFLSIHPHYDFWANKPDMADTMDFHKSALRLLGFNIPAESGLSQVGPMYPCFMAMIYLLTGVSFVNVRVVQCLIGALTCLVAKKLGTRLLGRGPGVCAGWCLAFYYPHVQLSGYVCSESLYTFLLCLSALHLSKLSCSPRTVDFITGSAIWVLAVMTRPAGLAFLPGLLALFGYLLGTTRIPRKWMMIGSAALLGAAGAWAISVPMTRGRTAPFVVQVGELLFFGNSPGATGGTGGDYNWSDVVIPHNIAERGTREADEAFFGMALDFIREHPVRCMELAVKKLWNMWRPFHSASPPIAKVINALCYLPAIFGAIICLRLKTVSRFAKAFLIGPPVLASVLHALLIGNMRYRYPLDPFVILLASPVAWRILSWMLPSFFDSMNRDE